MRTGEVIEHAARTSENSAAQTQGGACENQRFSHSGFSNKLKNCALNNGLDAKRTGKCMSKKLKVSYACGQCMGRLMKCGTKCITPCCQGKCMSKSSCKKCNNKMGCSAAYKR